MVKAYLMSANRASKEMLNALRDHRELHYPEWWASKLAVASAYLECCAECMETKQEMGYSFSATDDRPQNYMAENNLQTAARSSQDMINMLEDIPEDAHLPEWWKAKLYVSSHMLSKLNNAMKNILERL